MADSNQSQNPPVRKPPLTRERLKYLLHYDSERGIFIWLCSGKSRVTPGMTAGYIDDGYVKIEIDGRTYRAHVLAWFYVHGAWVPNGLDHADLDRSNNRISNLRLASRWQNMGNTKVRSDNVLGVKGVCARNGRYRALIRIDGRLKNLGTFDTLDEARRAYREAAKKHFGEFARD